MAGNWLSALGAKLMDAGTAYLEQVKVVQQLQRMNPAEAQQHFMQYVQGLSAAARAGFALTLSGLANNERDATARRFIESMSQALANPQAWNAGAQAPAPPPPAPQEPPEPENPLLADAERIDAWIEVSEDARKQAITEHADNLSIEGLEQWHENLAEIGRRMTERIAQHRNNEARIAAGRFVEDQHTYRLGRLAGAPPHAGWLAQLQQMQRVVALIEALQEYIPQMIEFRRQPPEPEPAEGAAPAASSDDANMPIAAFRDELEKELASGRVLGDRAHMLRRLLDKIEALILERQRNEIAADVALHRMRQLMDEFAPYIASPGTAAARATPRGRVVIRHAGGLKVMLMQQLKSGPSAATATALGALLGDVTKVQSEAADANDDAALLGLESGLLRPAARAAHELNLTRHALIARPLWACGEPVNRVNTIFFAGGPDLQELLESVAAAKSLEVDATSRLQNHGQMRWDTLNACHVAVFDLRGASELTEIAASAPRRAREMAGIAYELGLAFALGKPVLVVTRPGEELPFDIDLTPFALEGDESDAEHLALALDETFYVPQRPNSESVLQGSLVRLQELVADHPQRKSFDGMKWTAPQLASDPMGFAAAAGQVFQRLDAPRWQMLRPSWPGAYPNPEHPGCFHVMAFHTPWADEVRDVARAACSELGLAYRRGDEAEEGRIVHAIWFDLCRAAVVLVELTGVNLNVMIELGIAHAIGRPVLAVQRGGTVDLRPRHIEKLRVHRYATSEELRSVLKAKLKP
jgi:hypothetical protein